jgi:hypothetical protein
MLSHASHEHMLCMKHMLHLLHMLHMPGMLHMGTGRTCGLDARCLMLRMSTCGQDVDMTHAVLASHEHMWIMLRPLRMGGIQILDASDL